jgi:hypothetical protein
MLSIRFLLLLYGFLLGLMPLFSCFSKFFSYLTLLLIQFLHKLLCLFSFWMIFRVVFIIENCCSRIVISTKQAILHTMPEINEF